MIQRALQPLQSKLRYMRKTPYRWPGLRSSSPTSVRHCLGCRALIAVGYYDGWHVNLDPQPLDPRGEAEAWILNQPTYHAVPPFLYRRTVATIEELWNPNFGQILREHVCFRTPTYVKPPKVVSDDTPGF